MNNLDWLDVLDIAIELSMITLETEFNISSFTNNDGNDCHNDPI